VTIGNEIYQSKLKPNQGQTLTIGDIETRIDAEVPGELALHIERFEGPIGFDTGDISEIVVISKNAPDFAPDGRIPIWMIFGRNDGVGSLTKAFSNYKDRLAKGYVPFAESDGGNLFLWSQDDGQIYFWNHESPAPENSPLSITLVASDMTDFFERLTMQTIEPTQKPKILSSNLDFLKRAET